jgi:hypothetical protein
MTRRVRGETLRVRGVKRRPPARRVAEYWVRRAGRRLPEEIREERYREWAAELPAILSDPGVRGTALRRARAIRYALGVYRGAGRLARGAGRPRTRTAASGGWASRSRTRPPGRLRLPPGVVPGLAAVFLWVSDIVLIRVVPTNGGPDYPAVAVSIVASALGLVGLVRFVRWLSRESLHR